MGGVITGVVYLQKSIAVQSQRYYEYTMDVKKRSWKKMRYCFVLLTISYFLNGIRQIDESKKFHRFLLNLRIVFARNRVVV